MITYEDILLIKDYYGNYQSEDRFNDIIVLIGSMEEIVNKLKSKKIRYNIEAELFLAEDLVEVCNKSHFGLLSICDLTGTILCNFIYTMINPFSEGLAVACRDNKFGYIDKTCKEVIAFEYDYANDFHEGLSSVEKNNKWGYIDKRGKLTIKYQYDYANDFHEGLASVCIKNKWGYIDREGNKAIKFKYASAGNFHEGLAAVERDGKWGYIDRNGKEIIACKYDYASDFQNRKAFVSYIGKRKSINKFGKEVPYLFEKEQTTLVNKKNYSISDGKLYNPSGEEIEIENIKYKNAVMDIKSFLSKKNDSIEEENVYIYNIRTRKISLLDDYIVGTKITLGDGRTVIDVKTDPRKKGAIRMLTKYDNYKLN